MSLLLAAVAAFGLQTDAVTVQPKFWDGTLSACEIVFDNYFVDSNYLNGTPVHVAGSWSLSHFSDSNSLFGVLKVGVMPQDGDAIGPSDAYIISGYTTNKVDQKFAIDSEAQGFRLFGFDSTGEATMMALMSPSVEGHFKVGYVLGEGRSPQTFEVVMSDDHTQQYSDCVSALVRTIEQSIAAHQ
ncbi:hypothetical protein [Brevundimonas sp. NPDC058933]|uniref:hypothetical protein n=1 Tax=Brevundimonas sp. NPDC058933 TaxID=3346673 RepID=UPI003BEF1C78